MKRNILTLTFFTQCFLWKTAAVDFAEREKPQCKSNAHVCTSLMKYPDGSEFDEGPYCKCPGCSSKWLTGDDQSLSWPHYERADKTVQYKFCVPILPKRECEPGDLAITMGTTTGEWSPHIREARCACPDNLYQLLGWWRHPTQKLNNRTGQWIYEYFCEKPECTEERSPCAKIYIDQQDGDELILGYNFLCACPQGYKCPDRDEDETHEIESDFRGTYIPRYCKVTHKSLKQS
ncbi:U-scoloptoxin(11)-Sm7a-like [Mercenaria mercenaria]|uniref:U-scoloptoxin(11)-Sm7a-like n=1 Tax=Mercenaria mercenaria TaxID=6596 RepID=UPI001E1DDDBE|nr:U-scoloptoxin(11)-Sm7a-like [Mercenaria mercenaria]